MKRLILIALSFIAMTSWTMAQDHHKPVVHHPVHHPVHHKPVVHHHPVHHKPVHHPVHSDHHQ